MTDKELIELSTELCLLASDFGLKYYCCKTIIKSVKNSGVFRGGAVVRPPPPLAWSMLEAVRGRPPLAVIRGAVGGVWLVFERELRSAVEKM
jgi:hypothetical protein